MSDLQRRPGASPSRRQRAERAYQLTLATGGLALVAVIGAVLALLDVIGGGIAFVAAVLAVVCFLLLRRTITGR